MVVVFFTSSSLLTIVFFLTFFATNYCVGPEHFLRQYLRLSVWLPVSEVNNKSLGTSSNLDEV